MYEGEFHDGEYNGPGTWHYLDRSKLEGIWIDGIRNGQYKKIYPNGQEFTIEYQDDIIIENNE